MIGTPSGATPASSPASWPSVGLPGDLDGAGERAPRLVERPARSACGPCGRRRRRRRSTRRRRARQLSSSPSVAAARARSCCARRRRSSAAAAGAARRGRAQHRQRRLDAGSGWSRGTARASAAAARSAGARAVAQSPRARRRRRPAISLAARCWRSTEITPTPPTAMIGRVSESSPAVDVERVAAAGG